MRQKTLLFLFLALAFSHVAADTVVSVPNGWKIKPGAGAPYDISANKTVVAAHNYLNGAYVDSVVMLVGSQGLEHQMTVPGKVWARNRRPPGTARLVQGYSGSASWWWPFLTDVDQFWCVATEEFGDLFRSLFRGVGSR